VIAPVVVIAVSMLWVMLRDPHRGSTAQLALESGALMGAIFATLSQLH